MIRSQWASSYLFGGNAPYLEELYEAYIENPAAVGEHWRAYFDKLQILPGSNGRDVAHFPIQESFAQRAKAGTLRLPAAPAEAGVERKQVAVLQLIAAYRFLGVRWAQLDPLKRQERPQIPELEPVFYGLNEADLDLVFNTGTLVGPEQASLRDILKALKDTYCGSVGAEYMYIADPAQKRWIQQRLESIRSRPQLSNESQRHLLERLTAAETLERYLHTRYVGQKRFSLEGGETLIPVLDELIQRSGPAGVHEIVIGMAHRGRLNVLINTLGKSPKELFSEFEGKLSAELSSGDVKYHMGFSSEIATRAGGVHLSLAFNPSHLEIVNPVVVGSVRARQRRRGDMDGTQVLPILVHGDAAFAGQGVIMETLNLSQTRGYGTGGTVHVVVNNQIGFTTSDPRDSRSSLYCTDVAKMVEAPIFHVNADDPEAAFFIAQVAFDYRAQFHKDVVIDLVCYRRHGHNEQDEPAVTQPLMYKKIAQLPTTRQLYAERLITQKQIDASLPDELVRNCRANLEQGNLMSGQVLTNYQRQFAVDWHPFLNQPWTSAADTRVPLGELQRLAQRLTDVPANFKLHPRVDKIIADRRGMGEGRQPLDWGMAENLAYASLLESGYAVRLSGQDMGRGTFFHRHAVLHDQNRERWDQGSFIPLSNLSDKQASFVVIDSVLSEEAVLGFEYGYATAEPNEMVVWEAQFGDFANGAQVVIDQFISAGETKWGRGCGLVMLLPHGYEGQGPEHSSARLERYLQLCAEHNLQVCVPSTPSQVFHLLRRQMIRKFRKPLVVMSPKSLLRHKESVSSLSDLSNGTFDTVIPDLTSPDPAKVTRLIACSGKVFYDLNAARRERALEHVAIVRIEQLYPFPHRHFTAEVERYAAANEVVWVQEEPKNQGAWYQIQHYLRDNLRDDQILYYAGRLSSASPAVGYLARHVEQQKALIDQALGDVAQLRRS